jgi:hypothetical protein
MIAPTKYFSHTLTMQATAGRSDVSLKFMKTPPLQVTLGPASGT